MEVRGQPRILVVGTTQPSAHAVARSLSRAGFVVVGASEPARLAGRTRYCARTHTVPFVADGAAFAREIASLCELEAIDAVVPLADEMLGTLLAARPEAARWRLVGPSRAVFGLVCDKAELGAVAERAGLGRPEQVVAGPGTPLTRLPSLPAYVKVVSGLTEGRAAGRPTRVTDEGACRSVVAELVADGCQVLVQEEIDGEQWRFHFARSGGATAHVSARTISSYPPHTGQSSVSEFGPTRPDVEAAATALLDAVGYDGIGSIQMIARDGVWYPHDVNLRIPASVAGTIAAGLDMPRLGVEIALGRARAPRPVRARRLRFVQLHGELSAMRDVLTGHPSGQSVRRSAAEVALGALLPGRVAEPLDVRDPLPTIAVIAGLRRHRHGTAGAGA